MGLVTIRRTIYDIIEAGRTDNKYSGAYDIFMIAVIIASLVPLAFKSDCLAFQITDKICVSIFIVDYLLHLITADLKYGKKSAYSFIRYPFSFMAIIDLVSILPSVTMINSGFKILRVARIGRALRVFRVFKAARYSKSIKIIVRVFRSSKDALLAVGTLAIVYILISALIIINVEPDSFDNFFSAVYWATVSLTTMGYGDIYPVTTIGRIVTMLSSIFGIAIVALPAGIITAGYMSEIQSNNVSDIDNGFNDDLGG